MRVTRELEQLAPPVRGAVVSIGVFDGVHVGHRAILEANVAAGRARGLDDVGVNGALGEPAHVVEGLRLLLENLDEQVADELALLLRIVNASERREKAILGIDADHLHAQMLGEGRHDLLRLVQAQQSVVDEYAGELIADGAVRERRHHR